MFHTLLYVPIYNLLIFFAATLPGDDLGLAVIAATIVVRLIIAPLSLSALQTQRAMKALEPELKEMRERLKDDKEQQAKEMFALYKANKVNPFASILTVLIQLPIIIGLYWVFRTKSLAQVDPTLLYSFVHAPATMSSLFLGVINISGTGLVLAIIAAIAQYAQAHYAVPIPPKQKKGASMQEEMGRAMAVQMRFMMPLLIGVVAYSSGAIALYLITSSLFGLLQELVVRTKAVRGLGTSR